MVLAKLLLFVLRTSCLQRRWVGFFVYSLFGEHFIAHTCLSVPFQRKNIVEEVPKHLFLFSSYIWLGYNLCFLIFPPYKTILINTKAEENSLHLY